LLRINIFLIFLDHFDILISKIIFKKYYFNIFLNEKHFKKQLQPHSHLDYQRNIHNKKNFWWVTSINDMIVLTQRNDN
jgi:hypothetical protein